MQVSAGYIHNLALVEGGEVYSFGHGSSGKLGHGDRMDQLLPKLMASTASQQGRVVEVAAGTSWSLLLKEGGEMATLGGQDDDE